MKTQLTPDTSLAKNKNRQLELLNDIHLAHQMGAWECEPTSDHYFWSDSMFHIYGLVPSSDNLIPIETVNNMVHPKDRALVQHHWEELHRTGFADYFFRIVSPEGKLKQLHARNKAVLTAAESTVLRGCYREESSEIYQSLSDEIKRQEIHLNILDRAEQFAQTGTWQINLATFQTFYSDNVFRLHGVMPGLLSSHVDSFVKFIHPEDRNIVVSAFERSYHEKIPVHLEYRIVRQDEEVRYIQQVSSVLKNEKGEQILSGTTYDITEKKLLELSLADLYDDMRLQQELFHHAEQIASIGTLQINLNTRKVYYSDNTYTLFGIKPQSLLATPNTFVSYIHPEDRAPFLEAAAKVYEGFTMPQVEFRITRYDGKLRTFRQISKRLKNSVGEELLTAVIQDITEQTAFKMQLEEINGKLLIQNELHALAEKLVSIGSWFWNLNSGLLNYSDNIYHIHGLKPGSAQPDIEVFARFVHPEDKELYNEIIQRIRNEESQVDGEYRIIRADGDIRYLRSRNKLIISPAAEKFVIGTMQDITHEVLLSQQLSERIDFTEMLSDTILDTIIVTDTANNIIACNKQCESAHHLKKEEVFRKNIFDVFPQLKNAEMVENFRKALSGKSVRIPGSRSTLAKGFYDLLMQPLRNRDEQIVGVLLLLHDVTQEHQLQQDLKERLGFIEKLVESSVDRIMVLDHNLNYIVWNRICEKYYGVTKQEIIGKNVLELFPMFKIDPIYQDCKKALNGESIHIAPKKNNDDEYSESYLIPLKNDNGTVTGVLWIIHDLTDIMRTREKLIASETHLRTAQEIAHLGSWEYDHLSGKLSWSDEVFRIYGHEPASFDPTIEFYEKTSHPESRQDIRKLLYEATGSHSFINKIYTLDGCIRHVQTMGHSLTDISGNTVKVIGTVQDITDQVLLHDQLHKKSVVIRSQYELTRQAELVKNIGTWQWNVESGTVFWSENLFKILGYTPHSFELTVKKFLSFVHPDDREVIISGMDGVKKMERGTLPQFEYRMIDAEGNTKYIRTSCSININHTGKYVTGTMQDITNDILLKQEISWYLYLLQTVVESFTEAISIYDHNLHCIAWNKKSEEVYGKSKADTQRHHLFNIFPAINSGANLSLIEKVMNGVDDIHLEEASIEISDTAISVKPLVHSQEKMTGLLLISKQK